MTRLAPTFLALVLGLGCSLECSAGTDQAPSVRFEPIDVPAPAAPVAPTPAVVAPPPVPVPPPPVAQTMPIEPTIEPPPTPPEVPDTPLDLRIDGAPLRWRSARAYTRGGRALFVAFSSRARRGCPGNPTERDRAETTVHVRISPVLPSDGAGWRVGYASAFLAPVGLRMVDLRTPAAARIDAPPREVGDSIDGGIDLSSPEITARGRFRAFYCGDEPRTPEPATYDDVHVEVGGETIPIRGARFLIQDDMLRLVLSSNGSACGGIYSYRLTGAPDLLARWNPTGSQCHAGAEAGASIKDGTGVAELMAALWRDDRVATPARRRDRRARALLAQSVAEAVRRRIQGGGDRLAEALCADILDNGLSPDQAADHWLKAAAR